MLVLAEATLSRTSAKTKGSIKKRVLDVNQCDLDLKSVRDGAERMRMSHSSSHNEL
jgi:hypothetical protein